MRSLEECKAEIFRRSEVKIKQRKKTRNRILAACIPLCLCMGIGAAGAFSGGFAVKSDNMAQAPESALWNGYMYLADEEFFAQSNGVATDAASGESSEPLEEESTGTKPIILQEVIVTAEMKSDYETMKNILLNLEYSPHKVCKCLPQYKLRTDFGDFGIHLSEGYVRCEEGQAALTEEQRQTIEEILERLK